MEVRSANDVFGNCGAQTQCRRLWQNLVQKRFADSKKSLGCKPEHLDMGFTIGWANFMPGFRRQKSSGQ
jgi:hypothetical protein